MAQTQRLELRQGQSLVMTPQLQQSLKMLQLSHQELLGMIEQELEKNPLLQKQDANDEGVETVIEEVSDDGEVKVEESEAEIHSEHVSTIDFEQPSSHMPDDAPLSGWESQNVEEAGESRQNSAEEDAFSSSIYERGSASGSSYNPDHDFSDQPITREVTLYEHVEQQIIMDMTDAKGKLIAMHLLDLMDESGYIVSDFSELAEKLSCEIPVIESVLLKLQKCDPPGIFARSLAECLSLQLLDRNRMDPVIGKLLEHLDLLAKGDLKQLQKYVGVEEDELVQMIQEIKALDPKPGLAFRRDVAEVVRADIIIRRKGRDNYTVELNAEVLPKLLINKTYYAEVKAGAKKPEEKKYLTEQMNQASWLVRAVNQRAETMMSVGQAILEKQKPFFEHGISELKPMTLKDIAEKLKIHESTVGRVVTGKYMATPRGTYEMKFFFSSSIARGTSENGTMTGDSGEISSRAVKHAISELIQAETAESILSDDDIAAKLKANGMMVARRTVAKYREAIGIPSSSARRKRIRLQNALDI